MRYKLPFRISQWGGLWMGGILGVFILTCAGGVLPLNSTVFLLLLTCFVCELTDSSLGMGYGTTLTPILLLAGYDVLDIVPTVLISEFLSGLAAWFFHAEAGNVDLRRHSPHWRAGLLLGAGSLVGVGVGVTLAFQVPKKTLSFLIGGVILAAGLLILVNLRRQFVYRKWKLLLLATVASFNKGLSGGGYGPLMTSGQILGGISSNAAVAITSLAESVTCLAGALLYLTQGRSVCVELLIPACTGALISVPFSARIVRHVPELVLKICIASLTCLLGVLLLFKTFR